MEHRPPLTIKPPATFEEQLQLMKSRGLLVEDEDKAIRALQRINYYRLTAYSLSLKYNDQFNPGTTFEQLHALYEFDHRFRYLIMEMTEQVEIAFRTHISYHIAHTYGPLGHLEPANVERITYHTAFIAELEKETNRSQEIFIKHHLEKYEGVIPVWVAVEILSFGALSKWYANLKNEDKNQIAKSYYQAPAIYLESWLKCMSYVRNICAHYGRLYNRPLTSRPRLHPKDKQQGIQQDRIFAHLYVLKQLIADRNKWNNSFMIRLHSLLTEFEHVVELERIGFPNDWEKLLKK